MIYQFEKGRIEVGCDEAGRGCLAGPVYAAAVILDPRRRIRGLRDSKMLSATKREALREIIEDRALAWAVASVEVEDIDRHNIANASYLAMHRALEKLRTPFDLILVDGNRFNPFKTVRHACIVGGDDLYAPIAAASILAKTYRDNHMINLSHAHPAFGWDSNKGYPTKLHRQAIINNGLTAHHRKTFTLTYQTGLFSSQ